MTTTAPTYYIDDIFLFQYTLIYIHYFFRPFERTAADNDKIFSIFKTFDFFKENMPDNILKELCVVALLEQWKEQNFTGKVINRDTVKPILRGHLWNNEKVVFLRQVTS
jgi:hypothetical protein